MAPGRWVEKFPKAKPRHRLPQDARGDEKGIDAGAQHAAVVCDADGQARPSCQKPLTHSIYEARFMGQVAREKKVATMMGNQGTAMRACGKRRR